MNLIQRIHSDTSMFVLAVTGGGSSAISELLAVPGASSTLIESIVPYSNSAMQDFLGFTPDRYCSSNTARAMAMVAYLRARHLTQQHNLFGLGCTAALTTSRQRKGNDRCFISIQSRHLTLAVSLELDRSMDRPEQEQQCQQAILSAMAQASGLADQLEIENCTSRCEVAPDSWQRLISGEVQSTLDDIDPPSLVFPGAFNPYHEGHRQMIQVAQGITQQRATLEISIFNVDKPPLDFIDMSDRQKIPEDVDLVFTNAPTFADKSRLFPGTTFVVGVDTITRIADSKYYDHDDSLRDLAIDFLANNGHRFLVFGRQTEQDYQTLGNVDIPTGLLNMCEEVPESAFRNDISSTEIRRSSEN